MGTPIVYATYANNREIPLSFLKKEYLEVRNLLYDNKKKGYELLSDPYITTNELNDRLSDKKNDICFFSFSGHAGTQSFECENSKGNAHSLAELLGRCRNLKLVVLNGCSTAGQVKKLLEEGVPVVIATSVAVEDKKAADFAIKFFEKLVNNKNIANSFECAVSNIKLEDKNSNLKIQRNTSFRRIYPDPNLEVNAPIWGIYYNNKKALKATLPVKSYQTISVSILFLLIIFLVGLSAYFSIKELSNNEKNSEKDSKMIICDVTDCPNENEKLLPEPPPTVPDVSTQDFSIKDFFEVTPRKHTITIVHNYSITVNDSTIECLGEDCYSPYEVSEGNAKITISDKTDNLKPVFSENLNVKEDITLYLRKYKITIKHNYPMLVNSEYEVPCCNSDSLFSFYVLEGAMNLKVKDTKGGRYVFKKKIIVKDNRMFSLRKFNLKVCSTLGSLIKYFNKTYSIYIDSELETVMDYCLNKELIEGNYRIEKYGTTSFPEKKITAEKTIELFNKINKPITLP